MRQNRSNFCQFSSIGNIRLITFLITMLMLNSIPAKSHQAKFVQFKWIGKIYWKSRKNTMEFSSRIFHYVCTCIVSFIEIKWFKSWFTNIRMPRQTIIFLLIFNSWHWAISQRGSYFNWLYYWSLSSVGVMHSKIVNQPDNTHLYLCYRII